MNSVDISSRSEGGTILARDMVVEGADDWLFVMTAAMIIMKKSKATTTAKSKIKPTSPILGDNNNRGHLLNYQITTTSYL